MNAPAHFNKTATHYFDFIVSELQQLESLNNTDQPIIERLAFNLATIEACEQELFQDGYTIMGVHGKKEHPSVSIAMKAQAKVLESYKLLGLDAAHKLKIEQVKPEDLSKDPVLRILGRI
ncbi:P27 family phage terminase small subunit [Priestia megaterium]|uniref:P27 family phage terminase small subunit n=1 Tax=Priestia megaterium TaxID=1404 RepID=UPI0031FD2A33